MTAREFADIFANLELQLIASLKRNLQRHKKWEDEEGFKWPAWQAEKIRNLKSFRKHNETVMQHYTDQIDQSTADILQEQYNEGMNQVAEETESDIFVDAANEHFFEINERRVNSLIDEVNHQTHDVSSAALRLMDDVYRKTVHRAQLAHSTGALTYEQAVDEATKDFLSAGINCIEYKNGNRVNIASYADMVIRTTAQRSYFSGEAELRKQLGIDTVYVTQNATCSETCLPWQGKVYIDDVWGEFDGERSSNQGLSRDGNWYLLLSVAIKAGLFHPNCRHNMVTYQHGITVLPNMFDPDEAVKRSKLEARQRELERRVRKYKRLAAGSLDPDNIEKYNRLRAKAQKDLRTFIGEHSDVLRRDYWREKVYTTNTEKSLEKFGENGIINAYKGKGIKVVENPSISSDTVERVKEATKVITSDFKILEEYSEPAIFGVVDDGVAINQFNPLTGKNRIVFDITEFSNPEELLGLLQRHYEQGISYETDKLESLVAHEMGHNAHVALALKRANIKYGEPFTPLKLKLFDVQYNRIAQEIYLTAFDKESETEIFSICAKELGTRALSGVELIAQSFGNYYYGKNKSKIAKKIVKYFKRRLR